MMINKYKLADQMRNSMHIPDEYLVHLSVYQIMHWKIPMFKNELKDGQLPYYPGALKDGYTEYNVIYHQCTPVRAKKAQEVRLSFRAAKPEFNIEPYVLVQVVID